jgi:CYTH domain-containing protein
MAQRVPGKGRYAHVEREQRWIVADAPHDARFVASIVDRYIHGTRLRLRLAEEADGATYKLGQKVRDDPADPETVRLTNIYLSVAEYEVFAALPAAELRKTRSHVIWADHTVAIDRFHDRLDGIVLAEAELGAEEPYLPAPPWTTGDVTNDDRFSGGALAFATDEQIGSLLVER